MPCCMYKHLSCTFWSEASQMFFLSIQNISGQQIMYEKNGYMVQNYHYDSACLWEVQDQVSNDSHAFRTNDCKVEIME